jgi:NAD dependent epimerase/dehydratase family enzyme
MPNVPAFVLKLMFGELSRLYWKVRELHRKNQKAGFQFEFPDLKDA